MVSVPRSERPRGRQHFRCSGRGELIVVEDGIGQVAGFSQQQMRLLLGLHSAGGQLPKRVATREMWPGREGPLTAAMRASAARAITCLTTLSMVMRTADDVVLTDAGRGVVEKQRPMMKRLLARDPTLRLS